MRKSLVKDQQIVAMLHFWLISSRRLSPREPLQELPRYPCLIKGLPMISQDIVELNGLIEASLSARRRLASLNRISGLRLSELRSLEKACESADDEIEAFHHCHREPTHCEFAGVDAGRFTARKEIVALLAPPPKV